MKVKSTIYNYEKQKSFFEREKKTPQYIKTQQILTYQQNLMRKKCKKIFSKRNIQDPITGKKEGDEQTGMNDLSSISCIDKVTILKEPFYIAYFDSDFFSVINKVGGKKFGDLIIQSIGYEITKLSIKHPELKINSARLGGEEFLISFFSPSSSSIILFLKTLSRNIKKGIEKYFSLLSSSFNIEEIFKEILIKKFAIHHNKTKKYIGSSTIALSSFDENFLENYQKTQNISDEELKDTPPSIRIKFILEFLLEKLKDNIDKKGNIHYIPFNIYTDSLYNSLFLETLSEIEKNKVKNNLKKMFHSLQKEHNKNILKNFHQDYSFTYKTYITSPDYSKELEERVIKEVKKEKNISDTETLRKEIRRQRTQFFLEQKGKNIFFSVDKENLYQKKIDDFEKKREEKNSKNFLEFSFTPNGFKIINDRLGHSLGDRFLQMLSLEMRRILGDKFISIKKSQTVFTVATKSLPENFDIQKWYKQMYEKFLHSIAGEDDIILQKLHKDLEKYFLEKKTLKQRKREPLGECTMKNI